MKTKIVIVGTLVMVISVSFLAHAACYGPEPLAWCGVDQPATKQNDCTEIKYTPKQKHGCGSSGYAEAGKAKSVCVPKPTTLFKTTTVWNHVSGGHCNMDTYSSEKTDVAGSCEQIELSGTVCN